MKKLALSMAIVLALTTLMSTSVFAATIKPKAASTPSSSEQTTENDTSVTLFRVKPQKFTPKIKNTMDYKPVNDKKGSESITLENVVATKKEKITVLTRPNVMGERTSYKVDATIYEIPAGSKIITTSTPPKGYTSWMNITIYKPDAKGTTYTCQDNSPNFKIGEVITGKADIGSMFQTDIMWKLPSEQGYTEPLCGMHTGGATGSDAYEFKTSESLVFIRVVAAK